MSESSAEEVARESGSLPAKRGRSLSRDQEKEAFAAYHEGLTYREIGEVHGVDWGTLRKAFLRLDPEAARGPRPTETDRNGIIVGLRAVTDAARKLPPATRSREPKVSERARTASRRKAQGKLENAERFREKVRQQRAQLGREARIAETERMARARETARGARSVQEKILTAPASSLPEYDQPQDLRLDTVPPIEMCFSTAEDGARWVIDNFDEVDSHFLEAVEEGGVSDGILHAFLVQIGGFRPTLMTDREQVPTVLGRDSVGYLVELVAAIGKGDYSEDVKEDFASGLAGIFQLYGLPFNPDDAKMPASMMGSLRKELEMLTLFKQWRVVHHAKKKRSKYRDLKDLAQSRWRPADMGSPAIAPDSANIYVGIRLMTNDLGFFLDEDEWEMENDPNAEPKPAVVPPADRDKFDDLDDLTDLAADDADLFADFDA